MTERLYEVPFLHLRDQNFRREGSILAVAAEVAVQFFDDGVDAHQPEAVALALGGGEPPGKFCLLLAGREVGERDVAPSRGLGDVYKRQC